MAKDKKKKKKYGGWGDDMRWGREVGGGRDRDRRWDDRRGPKLTLNKDGARTSAKIISSPIKVPKEFVDNQVICNHAGDTITVNEFLAECSSPQAYVPMLERLTRRFGQEHVCVCARCFTPLVDPAVIDPEKVNEAIDTLYAASNAAVSAIDDLKTKEVERLGRGAVSLLEVFGNLPAMVDSIGGSGGGGADDLNGNPSGLF